MASIRTSGTFAALAVVVIWSISLPLSKGAVTHLGPWQFRFNCTVAGILPMLPLLPGCMRALRLMSSSQRRMAIIAAVLNGTVVASVNVLALVYFSASSVLAIMYAMPAFAALLGARGAGGARLLRYLPAALALAGVVAYSAGAGMGAGAWLMLGNAFLWAMGTRSAAHVPASAGPATLVTLQMLVAFLFSLPLLAADVLLLGNLLAVPRLADIAAMIYVGIVNGVLVFWLWYLAIRRLGAVDASFFTLLVPLLGSGFSIMMLGEKIGTVEILGLACICASMLTQSLQHLARNPKD